MPLRRISDMRDPANQVSAKPLIPGLFPTRSSRVRQNSAKISMLSRSISDSSARWLSQTMTCTIVSQRWAVSSLKEPKNKLASLMNWGLDIISKCGILEDDVCGPCNVDMCVCIPIYGPWPVLPRGVLPDVWWIISCTSDIRSWLAPEFQHPHSPIRNLNLSFHGPPPQLDTNTPKQFKDEMPWPALRLYGHESPP